jgi:sugar lactone lactonase YvrE
MLPRLVSAPRGLVTSNACFGGLKNSDLFITESDTGSGLRARW